MPTAGEFQRLFWGVVSTALYALPWILGGFGALAFLSYGPVGKALRRLLCACSGRHIGNPCRWPSRPGVAARNKLVPLTRA